MVNRLSSPTGLLNNYTRSIMLLRDLVDLAYAYHVAQVFNDNEDCNDFYAAWKLQDERSKTGLYPKGCAESKILQYKSVISISSQLLKLFSDVQRDKVHIIFQEDMMVDTKGVYAKVLSFLGLPDFEIKILSVIALRILIGISGCLRFISHSMA
jgi:hypothetical protein